MHQLQAKNGLLQQEFRTIFIAVVMNHHIVSNYKCTSHCTYVSLPLLSRMTNV